MNNVALAPQSRGCDSRFIDTPSKPGLGRCTGTLLILCMLALSACGGGGDTPAPTTATTINVDTGQTLCYTDSVAAIDCASVSGAYPGQDALFGRDAQALAGNLVKTGGGAAGFDYTRVCMNGTPDCTSPPDNGPTPPPDAWACTKDNHTGLTWSLQTSADNWNNAASPANLEANENHVTNANNSNRCGYTDWRLPTWRELHSIVHNGTFEPAIDASYFPGTGSGTWTWSSDVYVRNLDFVWTVSFRNGDTGPQIKSSPAYVRLVRSGQ